MISAPTKAAPANSLKVDPPCKAFQERQLDRITDLLCRAGDLAAKAIAAGSEKTADLELLGMLADRCGRTFQRLGIKRQPRDVESLDAYLARRANTAPDEGAEAVDGYPIAGSDEERTYAFNSCPIVVRTARCAAVFA
jgi:hypothetical protein